MKTFIVVSGDCFRGNPNIEIVEADSYKDLPPYFAVKELTNKNGRFRLKDETLIIDELAEDTCLTCERPQSECICQ